MYIFSGTIKYITTDTDKPTSKPRVTPPSVYENVSSYSDNGGIKTSTMFPCTFEIRIEEEVLAKAFCIIAMQTRPGARNSENR